MSMYPNSILIFVLAISFKSLAQLPSLSPQGSVEQQVGGTHVVRLNVPVRSTTRFYESLNFDIDVVPNNAVIHLSWANVDVSFLVQTGIDKHASDYISKKLLSKQSKNPEEYALAAEYMYYMGTDLESSNTLISHALTLKKELWYYRLKIDILERLKKFKEAFAVADEAFNWISSRKDWNEKEKTELRNEYEKRKMELLKAESK